MPSGDTEGGKRSPARRPPDRKERIAAAAARLFLDHGFHNVSVAGIAEAVGITASAVYRHFGNKQELLAHTVREGMRQMETRAEGSADADQLLTAMCTGVLERRGLPVLWQREARHLPEEHRAELRRYLSSVVTRYAALIRAARPELPEADATLLAWALLGVFASLTGQRFTASRVRVEAVVRELAERVVHCRLGAAEAAPADLRPGGGLDFGVSRRERLLTEAIRLFDERGFQSVSTDDIGEAVGVSGPSIYKHFPGKTDLLVAAVMRGGERRQAGTDQALARATGPRDALDRLLRSYVGFALENSHLIGLLISELDQLPEADRKRGLQVQRDYLALWEKVLVQVEPELDAVEARMAVRAVLHAVDNLARTGQVADRPDAAERLAEVGTAVLTGASAADRRSGRNG